MCNKRYKIIADSCADMQCEQVKPEDFTLIPLTLQVDDTIITDDETFNQGEFLELVRNSKGCPKSACPSPDTYMRAYEGEEEMVFVVTLSKKLSGSYNSALVGKDMYHEEISEDKKIHVFSSDSASGGETLVALKIKDLCEAGFTFEEIVEQTEKYINEMRTYFVLENLDFLKKNGRLTGVASLIVDVLNIRPVMSATEGEIIKLNQARGVNKALKMMGDIIEKEVMEKRLDPAKRRIAITYCNCYNRALEVKNMMCEKMSYLDVVLIPTAGVSSLYAGDGGIIVAI